MTDGRSHSTKHESNQPYSSTALRVICETAGQRRELTRQQHHLNHISYEPVTKRRTLEHRGLRTLSLYCIPHTTERTVKGNVMTTSLKKYLDVAAVPCNMPVLESFITIFPITYEITCPLQLKRCH